MATGGKGHEHRFDPVSGWCSSCNLRDDGKLISKGGDVWQPGREYTLEQLHEYRQRAAALTSRETRND